MTANRCMLGVDTLVAMATCKVNTQVDICLSIYIEIKLSTTQSTPSPSWSMLLFKIAFYYT